MRKKLIYIFIFIAFILSINNVYAYNEGDRIGTNVRQDSTKYSAWGIDYYKHYANIGGSDEFILCLQGGYAASNSKNLYVKMDLEAGSERERAYNAGMKAIFDKLNKADKSVNLNFVAAQQAARVFNLMWYKNGGKPSINPGNGTICGGKLCGHYKVTAAFYNEYRSSNLASQMKKATKVDSLAPKISGIGTTPINTVTDGLVPKIKEYFTAAVNAAVKSREAGDTAKITVGSLKKSGDSYISELSITKNGSQKLYLRLDCPECGNISDISISASTSKSGSYKKINLGGTGSGTNLADFVGNGKKMYVKIDLPARLKNACNKLQVTLKVTGENQEYSIYVAGDKNVGPTNGYQEFIVYIPESDGFKTIAKKKTTINTCKGCEDYYNACQNSNNNNSYACRQYQEKYGKNLGEPCAECATNVQNPECSTDGQKFSVTEGIEIKNNSCTNEKNVKDCIINQSDIVGNSYEATTSGYPSADSNPYCKVYCTEDYSFDMPGVQTTNAGRYLVGLETKISGTKSCYTNRINTEKFEEDLEYYRKTLIDAWNEWNRWYTGTFASTYQDTTGPISCKCNGSYSYTSYFRDWNYVAYNYNGTTTALSESVPSRGGGSCNCVTYPSTCGSGENTYPCRKCGSCSPTSHDGNPNDIISKINNNLNRAKNALEMAVSNYNKTLKLYNSCSGTIKQNSVISKANSSIWEMKYSFNPQVGFWYQDNYMSIAHKKLMEQTYYYMDSYPTITMCNGDTDSKYSNCIGGSWSGQHNVIYKNQFLCYPSGNIYACSNISVDISSEKYVKQTMNVNATYRLPSQYYIVFPGGKTVTKNVEGSSLLEEKLPISLNAAAGTYTYTLTVQGLGEYYNNSGKTGRIWGESDSVVYTALETDNACNVKGALSSGQHDNGTNGVYTCAYKVNCPDCPVTCEGDNCSFDVDCKDKSCIAYCEKCVFKLGTQNFTYRQISTDNINPNNRDLGANWKYNEGNISTKTEMKACVASNEIISNGDKVYDTESKDNNEKVLKVHLTQSMINSIKKYNKEQEDNGGFGNNTLTCYPYSDGNKDYNGVFCYSSFLDKYKEDYSDKFTFYKDRIEGKERKSKKNQCSSGGDCYWTTWNDALKNGISVTTNKCNYTSGTFDSIVDGDSKNAIGPSFK